MEESSPASMRTLAWLRFLTWIVPGGLLPFLFLVLVNGTPALGLAALLVFLAATVFAAAFQGMLVCQRKRIPKEDHAAVIWMNFWNFLHLQIAIAPLVMLLAFGPLFILAHFL